MVENFVADDLDHLESRKGGDGIDEHVAVDADEVLRVEDAVLILPCRVNDLEGVVLVLDLDLLAEGVLNGGVVALHEVVVDVAHRQR